jgi:hypothetical protein
MRRVMYGSTTYVATHADLCFSLRAFSERYLSPVFHNTVLTPSFPRPVYALCLPNGLCVTVWLLRDHICLFIMRKAVYVCDECGICYL